MEWQLGIAANGVIALAYAAIASAILRPLFRNRALSDNPLTTATGFIFASCSAGHAGHLLHLVGTPGLSDTVETQGARLGYDIHLLLVDLATAIIAVTFWSLRARADAVESDAPLFDETAVARRQALQVNEQVVQGLALANYLLETDEAEHAEAVIRDTLEKARTIVATPFQHEHLLPSGQLVQQGDRQQEARA